MIIKNSFEVPLPVEEAWSTLLNITKIAPCMPGAELLEVIDSKNYKGKVSVRLGPVALSFLGTARFEEMDQAVHRARVKCQGVDTKGRGGANGLVTFSLSSIENGTKVDVETDINLSGSVAQYGRGTGMIQDVANVIIGQFAHELRAMLEREGAATKGQIAGDVSATTAAQSSAPKPISGFSLMFRVILNSLRRLLSAK